MYCSGFLWQIPKNENRLYIKYDAWRKKMYTLWTDQIVPRMNADMMEGKKCSQFSFSDLELVDVNEYEVNAFVRENFPGHTCFFGKN